MKFTILHIKSLHGYVRFAVRNLLYFLFFIDLNAVTPPICHNASIIDSRLFYQKVVGKFYPLHLELAAAHGSIKSARELAQIWLRVNELIEIGEFRFIPDNLIEKYCRRALLYGKYWLTLGVLYGDAQSCYKLSLVHRFSDQKNKILADIYAKKAIEIWLRSPVDELTHDDYLSLVSCFGHGWGTPEDLHKAKIYYEAYVTTCKKTISSL